MEKLLTSKQVAKLFSIAEQTVRMWTAKGVLPSIKIGGIRRYKVSALEKLVGTTLDNDS